VRSFGSSFVKPDQKLHRAESSVEFVETIDGDRNCVKEIVTGEEIWCFMYDPETTLECILVKSKVTKSPESDNVKIGW
jgi:hypothetical protein